MRRISLLLAAAVIGSTLVSTAAQPPAPPRLVAPAEGAVVPLLNERQRAFLSMPHEERIAAYSNEAFRAELRKTAGYCPAKVRLDVQAVVIGLQLQRAVAVPGEYSAHVVILHDDIAHIRVIKCMRIYFFKEF